MLYNIKRSKKFPAQVEKIKKMEQNKGVNSDVDSNIIINKGTKMDKKDVIEKKRFENILKQYNKKEHDIHNIWNNGKKSKKAEKRIDKIVEKKKHAKKKDDNILFEYGRLQEINRKIKLQNILPQCQKQKKYFGRIHGQETRDSNRNERIRNKNQCCRY